ncbi:hypothetical protein FRB94_014035 [Tulasnella sp. JGI-2019a]|nr:hypothetical protein FRB93_013982 [Tulasnella sp. JGI-2019a]KAG9007707.1 hypothetical protein FRB94_014035 [Tulasnella sp. JGI-2019a]
MPDNATFLPYPLVTLSASVAIVVHQRSGTMTKIASRGNSDASSSVQLGMYLQQLWAANPGNFRLLSRPSPLLPPLSQDPPGLPSSAANIPMEAQQTLPDTTAAAPTHVATALSTHLALQDSSQPSNSG